VICTRLRALSLGASLLACSGLGACGGGSRETRRADASSGSSEPAKPATRPAEPPGDFRGVVRGTVKLADGAQLPLAGDPHESSGVVDPVAPCSPIGEADRRVVFAAQGTRGLTPIHVAVTGMKSMPTAAPRTHVVHALDCRFQPDLVGAQVGDTVRFENNSAVVLATAFPGDSFLRTLGVGESHEVPVKSAGVLMAGCPIGSFCGGTRIVAVAHPLWAVTDQAGSFRIEHVPLGEPVVVHAWHPLFGETSASITLDASAPEQELTLSLTPLPQFVAPASSAPPAAPAKRKAK
jgi:plastocyanin